MLALLLLVGCTSELDRCIAANLLEGEDTRNQKMGEFLEDWGFESEDKFYDGRANLEESNRRNDLRDKHLLTKYNPIENALTACERAYGEKLVDELSKKYPDWWEDEDQKEKYVHGLTSGLSKASLSEACTKEKVNNKQAEKICNTQGVY